MSTFVQEPRKPRPPATPIDILSNETAKIYTHIHPFLILTLYTYQFPSIVADPVPALTNTLLLLGALQIVYAAICLPPTGGGTATVVKRKPGEKKKPGPGKLETSINGRVIVSLVLLKLFTRPLTDGYL